MNASQLTIECYAEHKEDVWSALCLDFNLAAQGDSFNDAKLKLEAMISDYLFDILEGEDKPYAHQLLNRRAPWPAWVKYYYLSLKDTITHKTNSVFNETMPIKLA